MCAATSTSSATPAALDARERNIIVGDTVIYPTRRGSSLMVTEGEVTEIINQDTVKVRREREVSNYGPGFEAVPESRIVVVGTHQMVRL